MGIHIHKYIGEAFAFLLGTQKNRNNKKIILYKVVNIQNFCMKNLTCYITIPTSPYCTYTYTQ